jgi:hypothetical protein
MMKISSLTIISVFWVLSLTAQSWNPYVSQGIISPAPLLPVQLNGKGTVSFNVGNTGGSPLIFDKGTPDNNLRVVISLSYGLPDVDPLDPNGALKAIGGTWAQLFSWKYDMTSNSFTGMQNQEIKGQSQGSVTIQFKVTKNSPPGQQLNGFSVHLNVPGYAMGTNSVNDDQVSSYTLTQAGE